jgi:signal transduction histidine kinase
MAHQLQERNIELVIEAMPDLVSDRLAVEQIFGNLIDNAVKYVSPERTGRIMIRGQESGGGVRYEVEDNGRGIDPKDFERIFDLRSCEGSAERSPYPRGWARARPSRSSYPNISA